MSCFNKHVYYFTHTVNACRDADKENGTDIYVHTLHIASAVSAFNLFLELQSGQVVIALSLARIYFHLPE